MTSLLLDATGLETRRAIVAGPLAPLARSLADDLSPLLSSEIHFPHEKALLSREGGRCPTHGVYLEFDPFRRHDHRCPIDGEVFRGALHDRFWIYWYQLWLAERAVHAAALSTLGVDDRFAALADAILDGYAERYATYPNVDNVLGPTRLFFSTYLESIWLLQICVATDLIATHNASLAARVIERIIEPSRSLIAEYDEGGSNRQVWNNVALLAAARLVGDRRACDRVVYGTSGIASLLAAGLLSDGTWYEGENYHLFAHRGLWYGVTMAERAALELPRDLVTRFQLGFSTPFATALPDFTLPSRRDSQYAISLRQWRIAEHCELGVARASDDETLIGALQRMYDSSVPRVPTGRNTSSADVERNVQASALSRADLSWRALLFANAMLPPSEARAPRSALLDAQGIAVFRRDARRAYIALDYGHSGGGHGHPDRLNLLLARDETRWLDDFGTGSYVDPSLHWYRSTLAHNAPLANGRSQLPVHGTLIAYDERGAAGWISAAAEIAPGVSVVRTVISMPTYVLDTVEWTADADATIDLPFHVDMLIDSNLLSPIEGGLFGGDGLEDGFRFLANVQGLSVPAGVAVRGAAAWRNDILDLWSIASGDSQWWSATAPGAPGHGDHRFSLIRARGVAGTQRTVCSWANEVADVVFGETVRVSLADGSVHEHAKSEQGWRIGLSAGTARSSIDLAGRTTFVETAATPYQAPQQASIRLPVDESFITLHLGPDHYRRSEASWRDAGEPTATVSLAWTGHSLIVIVDVPQSDVTFVGRDAVNPYDNEPPDINGDGVQFYVRTDRGDSGWLLVPESASDAVRVRPIAGWSNNPSPTSAAHENITAGWRRLERGYAMRIELATDTPPVALDLIVNEMPRSRERRRGQLVLSGASREFIYLRGDRHEAARLVPLRLTDA